MTGPTDSRHHRLILADRMRQSGPPSRIGGGDDEHQRPYPQPRTGPRPHRHGSMLGRRLRLSATRWHLALLVRRARPVQPCASSARRLAGRGGLMSAGLVGARLVVGACNTRSMPRPAVVVSRQYRQGTPHNWHPRGSRQVSSQAADLQVWGAGARPSPRRPSWPTTASFPSDPWLDSQAEPAPTRPRFGTQRRKVGDVR